MLRGGQTELIRRTLFTFYPPIFPHISLRQAFEDFVFIHLSAYTSFQLCLCSPPFIHTLVPAFAQFPYSPHFNSCYILLLYGKPYNPFPYPSQSKNFQFFPNFSKTASYFCNSYKNSFIFFDISKKFFIFF